MGYQETLDARNKADQTKAKWELESRAIVDDAMHGNGSPWFADSVLRPRNMVLWYNTKQAQPGEYGNTLENPEYDRMMDEYRKKLNQADKVSQQSGWFDL